MKLLGLSVSASFFIAFTAVFVSANNVPLDDPAKIVAQKSSEHQQNQISDKTLELVGHGQPNGKETLIVDFSQCDFCRKAVAYIKTAADSKLTKIEIKIGLQEICKKMPPLVDHACDVFLEAYYEKFFAEMDVILADPDHFCGKIELCAGDL